MVTVCPSQFATRRTLFHVLVGCGLFFFKAKDGIRDSSVTGVQTCALPIYPACRSVDYGVHRSMRISTKFLACVCIATGTLFAGGVAAQNSPAAPPKPQTPPSVNEMTRITIEETGGEKNDPVEKASPHVKFIVEHSIEKDK